MNTAQDKKQVDHNGYWYIENNPISRTGVFPYLGKQISDELEPDKVYQVYRPAEELFSPEAMASFKLMPLVDEHTMLGKDYTPAEQKGIEGVLGEKIGRSGDMLTADIKIYSESLKDEIRNGKEELSMGYFCDYDLTPGTYKGRHYDAVQRNLRGNHIALVDKGRMGREVRVMDKALNMVKNCPVHDSISIDDRWMTAIDYNENHDPKNGQIAPEVSGAGNMETSPVNTKITEALKTTPDKLAKGVIFALTGNPVASINGNEFPKTEKHIVDDVTEYYQKEYGGKITHPELGDILLDYKGVKNDFRHGISRLKCASFICVPQVILKGQIYAVEKNRKGKGYDTYCIIAPVEINGKRYIEEVVIKSSKEKNRLYLHEVEIKEKLEDLFLREPQTQGNKNLPASQLIIAEKIAKIKSETEKDLNNGSDEAAVNKENTMDRREVIREIMAIAAKDPGEFKGGEEEKIETISALAEKLAYGDGKEDKPEADNITTAVPEEETETETETEPKTENEEEEDAARCDAEPQAVQGTRLEIKALPPEKDDLVKKAADMAAEKVSKNIYEMQELKARITPHIGEFDSSKMRSVADMADYALRKMGKKAKGDKVAYLEGCLSEMKQERQLYGMAADEMEADTLDEILKGVK